MPIITFKDVVEKKAADHDIPFCPINNRKHEGKQVYQFGQTNIFIDQNVLFVLSGDQWTPMALNNLLFRSM